MLLELLVFAALLPLLAQQFSLVLLEWVWCCCGVLNECWCEYCVWWAAGGTWFNDDDAVAAANVALSLPTLPSILFGCVSHSFINWMICFVSFMWFTWIASDYRNGQLKEEHEKYQEIIKIITYEQFDNCKCYLHWPLNLRNCNISREFGPYRQSFDHAKYAAPLFRIVYIWWSNYQWVS